MYDKSKPFILDYKTIIGCSIAVIKKAAKASIFGGGFRPIFLDKKRRGRVLEGGSGDSVISPKVQKSSSWGFETSNTTKSESVDMEEECLVEETSFDYSKSSALAEGDHDQTPTDIRVKTKKTLGKPLGKIDFLLDKDNDNVLLDTPLALFTPVKKLVAISVRKFFTLNIGLDKITGKSSQEKLVVVRKLFSRINGFGEASTPSKFAEIIRVTFTSELSLVKATKMATNANIMVNTNLKKSAGHSDQAVVLKEIPVGTSAKAVRAVLSEFGIIKSIKMQLVGLWQKAVVEFEQSGYANLVTAK
ncbi:hypothetical protein G9A89_014053 [Geosiphon pyriformis]|nr:hypothetical protein G9A89_014053 [Geosiphon pyriformis]